MIHSELAAGCSCSPGPKRSGERADQRIKLTVRVFAVPPPSWPLCCNLYGQRAVHNENAVQRANGKAVEARNDGAGNGRGQAAGFRH